MEPFESLRVPFGPFFVRLDVRKASKTLKRWDEGFHRRLVEAFRSLRSRGLPAYLAFAISDELNVLFGDFFSRRVEKIVSVSASVVSISLGLPVDARIVYTPSLLSAVKYLERRQVLGYRNALMKEAFERTLAETGDRNLAKAESSRPVDQLRRKYSRFLPKRALLGTIARDDQEESRDLRDERGKKRLIEVLKSFPLEWSERLFRIRVSTPRCSVRVLS